MSKKTEFNPTPPRDAIRDGTDPTGRPPVDCEECLKNIPADARTRSDMEEYVRQFCGEDCYRVWKDRQEAARNA